MHNPSGPIAEPGRAVNREAIAGRVASILGDFHPVRDQVRRSPPDLLI